MPRKWGEISNRSSGCFQNFLVHGRCWRQNISNSSRITAFLNHTLCHTLALILTCTYFCFMPQPTEGLYWLAGASLFSGFIFMKWLIAKPIGILSVIYTFWRISASEQLHLRSFHQIPPSYSWGLFLFLFWGGHTLSASGVWVLGHHCVYKM